MHLSGGLHLGSLPGLVFPGDDMVNPLVELPEYAGWWADDPAWSAPSLGAAVSSWRTAGTLTTAATQGTGANQPTLTTSALLGGRRVVDFGGSHWLEITSGVSLAQPFEVWWIGTFDTFTGFNTILGLNSTAASSRFGTTTTPNWALRIATATTGGTPVVNTAYAARAVANGASSAVFANGTSVIAANAGTDSLNQVVIGAGRTAPSTYGNYLDGKTAFLAILPAASITQQMRTRTGQWAAQFYSVPAFTNAFG